MCGIYGITCKDEQFIRKYIEKCSHRGPDGSAIWSDDHITLGHNLLSITDNPKVSGQPWKTDRGNILIFNGEIFNYYDLIIKYPNFIPKTVCDTELLAWGLDNFGIDFINDIDSMHSFAYYDIHKKQLIISRDHAGIKPLYFSEIKDGIVFGSEIKGMLDIVPNSNVVDPLALSCMAHVGLNPTRNTFFKNIKKVLSGETFSYDVETKTLKLVKRDIILPTTQNHFDHEEFRECLRQSVKLCSIGKKTIGIFLSGGLDSGIVAYEFKKLHGYANTYTNMMEPNVIHREDDHNDDHNKAYLLAQQHDFDHHVVKMTPSLMREHWKESIRFMEQPVYNPSMVMYYCTNKYLSDNGIVVTLAGDMGDEVLGGYPKYWKLKQKNIATWQDLIKQWMNRIKRPILLQSTEYSRDDIEKYLQENLPNEIFNPEDKINSYMALDCITQVPEEFFIRNDTYGMAFSMEGRFPLATKNFMKYALSIPSNEKIGTNKSDTKLLSKKAYSGIFPNEIVNKHKTGWTAPVKAWVQEDSKSKKFYENCLNESDCLRHLISPENFVQKSAIPSWIMRDWAKVYNMTL